MVLERSSPISETMVFDEALPSDDEAEEPALDAMSGMGVSLLAGGGIAETGADVGNPEDETMDDDDDDAALLVDVVVVISLRFNASCKRCSNSVCRPSCKMKEKKRTVASLISLFNGLQYLNI